MSSIRSSFDELSVMVACTRTMPCSTRSPRRTRTTPIGMDTSAETSATERLSQVARIRSAAGLRSGLKPAGLAAQGGLDREVDRGPGAPCR